MEIWVLTFVLILVRTSVFVAVIPIFGAKTLPKTVLIGLALALSTMLFCNLQEPPADLVRYQEGYLEWFGFFMATIREVMVAVMLGLAFGLFIYPIQIAGAYLAQEMGLSIANLTDPSTQSNSNVLSSLFQTLGLMLFFSLNLHHFVFAVLHSSFQRLPIGRPITTDASNVMVDAFSRVDQMGLSIIAPAGICLFITMAVLILLTKVSPQMNLFSIGLSIRVGAGLIFVLMFIPNIFYATEMFFEHGQNWILGFMEEM